MNREAKSLCKGIIALLLFVGATSCDTMWDSNEESDGTPTATYIITGKVTTTTQIPIEGIRVDLKGYDIVTTTDAKGKYSILAERVSPSANITINFTDIDGELNGSFIDQSQNHAVSIKQYSGGDESGWHHGTAEILANARLDVIPE